MARKDEKDNAKTDAPAAETNEAKSAEATETKAAPLPELTPEERAKILADKQAHGVLGKVWKMKGGTDIPQRFDANEAQQYEAKLGATNEETLANMLVFAGGEIQAVLDSFNAAHRLAGQKAAKDLMKVEGTDLAKIQESLHSYTSGSKRRGTGGAARTSAKVAKAEKAKTEAVGAANEMLEELRKINPEAAAKYEARLASIGA